MWRFLNGKQITRNVPILGQKTYVEVTVLSLLSTTEMKEVIVL